MININKTIKCRKGYFSHSLRLGVFFSFFQLAQNPSSASEYIVFCPLVLQRIRVSNLYPPIYIL